MAAIGDEIIGRKAMAWMLLVGGTALCAMLTLLALGDLMSGPVASSSSYSRSATGHSALVALLRDRGHRVVVNRSRQAAHVTDRDLLLVLEPNFKDADIVHLKALVRDKGRVLAALPKWRTEESSTRRGWIDAVELVPTSEAAKVAVALIGDGRVVRVDGSAGFKGSLGAGQPAIENLQLLEETSSLKPLLATSEGILLGKHRTGGRIALLADPDLIANHGLHRGDNAKLALAAIDHLLPAGGTIHVDETLHGFALVPSLRRLLFQPPYLAATLLALAALAVTVWQAAVRFGAPVVGTPGSTNGAFPTGNGAFPSGNGAFPSGNAMLIRNAGRLLVSGDHGEHMAERYGAATLDESRRRLHLPPSRDALRDALDEVAARRGVRAPLPAPGSGSDRPLKLARRYFDWMKEMFDGSGTNRHAG